MGSIILLIGDVPLEVLTQIIATISDPSSMLGPEVQYEYYVSCSKDTVAEICWG